MDISNEFVGTLLNQGQAFVAVDQTLVEDANGAMGETIQTLRVGDRPQLVRPGEGDCDVGLVYRPGKSGFDHKYFFHLAPDFTTLADDSGLSYTQLEKQLAVLERLYALLGSCAIALGQQIDDEFPDLFSGPLATNIQQCLLHQTAYSSTTLRGLWYPAGNNQHGAKKHIDCSFLSIHLGDKGGKLIGLKDEHDEVGEIISPEPGQALIFFGVKAFLASRGKIEPLWHYSTVDVGQDRKALVQFTHIDTGSPVIDAKAVYDAFRSR